MGKSTINEIMGSMRLVSITKNLLLDFADRCLLFMSEGRSGPYAASLGSEEYYRILNAQWRKQERKRTREYLERLQKQKLLVIRKVGETFHIRFSTEGAIIVLKDRILKKETLLPDGERCLVSFDVPESIRSVRWSIRDLLKKAKFKQVHKSVWVSDRDVCGELRELARLLHADRGMKVYRVLES